MNYLLKLQADLKQAKQNLKQADEELQALKVYLNSKKFRECEGELRNYVNVQDVLNRVEVVRAELHNNFNLESK